MSKVGELSVKITGDSKGLDKSISNSEKSIKGFTNDTEKQLNSNLNEWSDWSKSIEEQAESAFRSASQAAIDKLDLATKTAKYETELSKKTAEEMAENSKTLADEVAITAKKLADENFKSTKKQIDAEKNKKIELAKLNKESKTELIKEAREVAKAQTEAAKAAKTAAINEANAIKKSSISQANEQKKQAIETAKIKEKEAIDTAKKASKAAREQAAEVKKQAKIEAESRKEALEDTNKELNNSLASFKAWSGSVGAVLMTVTKGLAGIAAGSAAFLAFANSVAKSRRELETYSRQAGETVEDFRSLSFATQQYNVSGEQFADITKDMKDKLGEFAGVGTGVFQDYVDIMKLTKEEGQALAQQLSELSGRDAIQYMIDQMQSANVDTAKMTFVLESMGNELSRLIPLFSNGGKEVEDLTGKFKGMVAAVNDDDIQAYRDLARDMGLATESFKVFITDALAPLAPMFETAAESAALFFKKLTEESQAADKIADSEQEISEIIGKRVDKRGRTVKFASEEAGETNKLLLENQKLEEVLNSQLKVGTGRMRLRGEALKAAQEELEKAKELAAKEIESNNARIAQLTAESEAAKKVLDIRQQINNVSKPTETDVKPPSVSTEVDPDSKPLIKKLTLEESNEFLDDLRSTLNDANTILLSAYQEDLDNLNASLDNGAVSAEEYKTLLEQLSLEMSTAFKGIKIGEDLLSPEQLQADIDALNQSLMTQEQLINESYNRRLEVLKAAKERGLEIEGGYAEAELAIKTEHEEKLKSIRTGDNKYSQERNAEFINGLLERNQTELDIELTKQADELARLQEYLAQKQATEEEARQLTEQLEKGHEERKTKIVEQEAMKRQRAERASLSKAFSTATSFANAGFALLKADGKRSEKENQRLAKKQILVNTALGIMKALSTSATIYDGWVNAALVGVQGAAQLAAIGSGGGGSSGVSGAPSAGDIPLGDLTPAGQVQQTNQTININVTGKVFDDETVRDLIEEINNQVSDGVTINAT